MRFINVFRPSPLIFAGGSEALHPYDGLTIYGPYSQPEENYDEIVILYDAQYRDDITRLKEHIEKGYRKYYPNGFNSIFKTNLKVSAQPVKTTEIDPALVAQRIWDVFSENGVRGRFPLILIEKTPKGQRYTTYYEAKGLFARNSIPTQFITTEVLRDPSKYKWSLFPLTIQIFVKMGGTPYALYQPLGSAHPEACTLVMGVGITRIYHEAEHEIRYMGFITLFGPNGEWLVFNNHTEPYDREKLASALRSLILETIIYGINKISGIEKKREINVIIHYSGKNFSSLEEMYLWRATQTWKFQNKEIIPHVIKLQPKNENVVVLDKSPCVNKVGALTGYVSVGTVIEMMKNVYMLFTAGCIRIRERWRPNAIGTPCPVLVSVKDISKVSYKLSDLELVESVFQMCRLNYMSINNPVNKEPITTRYSRELAYMVAKLGGRIPNNLAKRLWFI